MILFYKNRNIPFSTARITYSHQTATLGTSGRTELIFLTGSRKLIKNVLIPFYYFSANKSLYSLLIRFLASGSIKLFMDDFFYFYRRYRVHVTLVPSKRNKQLLKAFLHMNIVFYFYGSIRKPQAAVGSFQLFNLINQQLLLTSYKAAT